jgi:hypothetical protein
MRDTITFMLEDETESRKCRDARVLLINEIESRKCRDAKVLLEKRNWISKMSRSENSFEKSTANENWFQKMLTIEFIIVKMMILKQSKKRRAFFRRHKFDVLIEFI